MKHRFSTDIIGATAVIIAAIAVGSACLTFGTSGGSDVVGIADVRGYSGPVVLAQYNPCPNRKCR